MTVDHPAGADYPILPPPERARRPDPIMLARGYAAAADVIHSLHNHIGELDACDLGLPDGRGVRLVTVSEVESWLSTLEARVRAGTGL